MPKACRYAMMKSQRLKHFFGRLLCEYTHFFGGLLCECLHFFGRLFYLGFSWGKKCFVFVGEFLGDFITLWVVLIFYDEDETCGFDFCADGGGVAVGGSKWRFHFGEV